MELEMLPRYVACQDDGQPTFRLIFRSPRKRKSRFHFRPPPFVFTSPDDIRANVCKIDRSARPTLCFAHRQQDIFKHTANRRHLLRRSRYSML